MIRTFTFRRIAPFGCTAEEIHTSWTQRVHRRRTALFIRWAKAGKPAAGVSTWQRHNRKIYFTAPRKIQELPA